MGRSPEADQQFWREVLLAGGSSELPRWSHDPGPEVLETNVELGDELVSKLRSLTSDLAISLSSVLLAGHARVLAALCGQPEVVVGYIARGAASPLPCRLDTSCHTWGELLAECFAMESALLTHRAVPLEPLRASLGVTGPAFDTVFDPTSGRAGSAQLAEAHETTCGVGLWVEVTQGADGLVLTLSCRARVWDAQTLTRVGGYHLRALEEMATDVDADHSTARLLADDETTHQIHGLAGPHRPLPDLRVHELIEANAASDPEAIAAIHGVRRWTYRELNDHANRLGRSLVDEGLTREDVVAVVCERNLDWMAAVLAVFKAGGAYLPIEPNFPAERITTMLARSGCTWVLTQRGATTNLDEALQCRPDTRTLYTSGTATAQTQIPHLTPTPNRTEPAEEPNLGVPVSADQLAYIYFTSGSTGEPKGAMCEHAGMLNHLHAKIADAGLTRGGVLAQTAPQGFDISLWQLLAAPLAGGTTLIVGDDDILDVTRFVDTLVDAQAQVVQLVPSYLEAVVAHLEHHPRALPHLRCVSTTGEALTKDLAARWFTLLPEIPLLNAYGLTETSDDTNHEILRRPPHADRVPLGPPIQNVHIYVLDEHLQPVPLGSPGEIVHSGICVGRGYVNDPERTETAYLPDPHRPGHRLHRGGDIGRWLPDGKLEFLGRRDSQVKIRGFRVEIGEIESILHSAEGVRDGAVVVTGTGYDTNLVAFYTGPGPIDEVGLAECLRRSLPSYMIPVAFHWREQLPLTGNHKIDRMTLAVLADELDISRRGVHPASDLHLEPAVFSAAEERVAAAWEVVLGVPRTRLRRQDHFFERGGTSLSAVKLAIILKRAVSYRDVTEHPTLAQLADLLEHRNPQPEAERSSAS